MEWSPRSLKSKSKPFVEVVVRVDVLDNFIDETTKLVFGRGHLFLHAGRKARNRTPTLSTSKLRLPFSPSRGVLKPPFSSSNPRVCFRSVPIWLRGLCGWSDESRNR